jgi:hypothetical protein
MKPRRYNFWCQSACDRFDERVAIMREANNIPSDSETPGEIIATATLEAQQEHNAVKEATKASLK